MQRYRHINSCVHHCIFTVCQDFYRPIITPYELEVALRAEQSWTGRYVLDFEELLAEHANDHGQTDADDDDEHEVRDEDSPVFSLVTGKYRHAKRFGPANGPSTAPSEASASASSSALVQRNQDSAVALLSDSAAGGLIFFQCSYIMIHLFSILRPISA